MSAKGAIRVAVLTVSDRCAAGEMTDTSGPALCEMIASSSLNAVVAETALVPDEVEAIQARVKKWSDEERMDLIITTGGTGFAPRDVTPEAISPLLHKHAPGLVTTMMAQSLAVTPMAALARPVCGVRNDCLIATLPGSKKGSCECLSFLMPILPHALSLLRSDVAAVQKVHAGLESTASGSMHGSAHGHRCPHTNHNVTVRGPGDKAKFDTERVAHRARHSEYRLVSMDEAIQTVLRHSKRARVDSDLGGHVLAQDVHAAEPLPPFPASIKDGYAVIAADGSGVYEVLGPSLAGETGLLTVTRGTVARITTGAPVPNGADAVVQVEDTELVESTPDGKEELRIKILTPAKAGQDIRPVGFDIAAGEMVLTAGTVLGPSEIGLLATLGCIEVKAYARPRVAVLSTGNELVGPGEPLATAKIRDSNKSMLMAAIREIGAEPVDAGISKDTREELSQSIKQALNVADILVTTGGVSMGEKDLLKPVLQDDLGATIHFGRLFMKPGKPTTFATVGTGERQKLVFALPGNPVSAMVTFYLFVHMAVRSLAGHRHPQLPTVKAKMSFTARLDPRPEYHRAILTWDDPGRCFVADSTGSQCSSRLTRICYDILQSFDFVGLSILHPSSVIEREAMTLLRHHEPSTFNLQHALCQCDACAPRGDRCHAYH